MSQIICQWLNAEVCLSKVVDPVSLSSDFANGFLIGEILNKFELQQDFQLFSKNSTENAKLNNFSRIKQTLQLLDVPFDLNMAKAVMQGRQGAATNLLYQLYIVLQKKKRSGLTATAMEIMKPAATARLHSVEKRIFTERLKTVVKRETDTKVQEIEKRFAKKGPNVYRQSIVTETLQKKELIRQQEHRQSRGRQQEKMNQVKPAVVQIPKPPHSRPFRALEKRQQLHKQQEAEQVYRDIAQFEKNQKSVSSDEALLCSGHMSQPMNANEREHWNREYMEKIRLRLEEDSTAREQRQMRRQRSLIDQFKAFEVEQEMIREEQMAKMLMRQTTQQKRIGVQLMQIRKQKEVLRQNRIFLEQQYKERRQRDIQEALNREAVLAHYERLEHSEEIRMEQERIKHHMAKSAQDQHRKKFDICRGILDQIFDLATKAGEYRLLTDNQIPRKLMQEWIELFLSGKPLYEVASVEPVPAEPTAEQIIELQKLQILNNQDYQEYVGMMGEWVWSKAEENQSPTLNNDILDHVVKRMKNMIKIPISTAHAPVFPRFTIRACVLGKTQTGKTCCLTRITNVLGVHVLSVNTLIQNVLTAYQHETQITSENQLTSQTKGLTHHQRDEQQISSSLYSGAHTRESDTSGPADQEDTEKLSLSAQRGAAVHEIMIKGKTVPDQLLVDIVVDAIRNVPADSGWVLDGFPVNISQAVMLEKALTGSQPDETPEHPSHPSPALDLIVLLDVSDEQVLERGLREDPAFISSDRRLERYQIQYRICGFHDTWPKLEKWFGDKQNILVKVPAETSEDLLFQKVEKIIKDTMESVERGASEDHLSSCEDSHVRSISPTSAERLYVDDELDQEIAEYLVSFWENMCTSYEIDVKKIMQNLRAERELIICHLYDIRENFRQHLLKPDQKQEFVSSWQQDYNSLHDNIRDDEETKSELHQRLDELRERLWDICNKRKDEAIQERAAIINDGWSDDHSALVINNYSALMQTEVVRFQDSVYLLRDYYSGMSKSFSSRSSCDVTRVPLLDVSWTEHMGPQASDISSGSGPSEEQAKNAEAKDTRKLFPLITSRSLPKEFSKQDLLHPDEKLLQEIYQTATRAVRNMVSAEVHQREEDDGDEEQQQQQQQMETQRTHRKSQAFNSARDKRKDAKQKAAPPSSHECSPQPAPEENPEEMKRRTVRRKIRCEFTAALKNQEDAVKICLELLKTHAVKTLCSLQHKTQQIYTNMQEWLETRFQSEINSIEQLIELVQQHIENGFQIRHELALCGSYFCVDGDTRVVASPPPTPAPPLLERYRDSRLTVQQLNIICAQLHKIAPLGMLLRNELMEFLLELNSPHMNCDVLPEPWTHMTSSQVVKMLSVCSRGSEMLDWRQFVLSAALPWPFASQSQLLKSLQRYKAVDTAGTGLITHQQYTQVELWFPGEKDHLVPDDPSEPSHYDRLDNLKKFFFSLFASTHSSPVMLDYMNMLLYFCCHPEAAQGFIRALSLVTEQTLHYKHTGPLVQSVAHMEGAEDEEFEADEKDGRGAKSDEEGVSVDDVLRVLSHGVNLMSAHVNRFHSSCRSTDEYREELMKVWKELGFKAEEKIPFSVFSQHPFLQELIEASTQYLFVDIHKILQTQKTEGESKS